MPFRRWHSIENYYRQKNIDRYVEHYPELVDAVYIITEKLHGASFQWEIQPGLPIRAGSRRQYLDMKGSFQGANISQLLQRHAEPLANLQSTVENMGQSIRLFGELVGEGIQRGVDYGPEKHIRYFGLMVSDILVPFDQFLGVLECADVSCAYRVPIVATVIGLQAALEYDTRFDSRVLCKPNNLCEGVVIQPHDKVYFDGNGSPFILKKKNKEFQECQKVRAPKNWKIDPEIGRLHTEFLGYVTANRVQTVLSKYGVIEEMSQIEEYIRYVLADAREDFEKDFGKEMLALEKNQQRQVYNVGGKIAGMLKKELGEPL